MKKITFASKPCLISIIIFFSTKINAQSNIGTKIEFIKKTSDSSIVVYPKATVPKGETYNIFDKTVKFITTYNSGQQMIYFTRATDCVQIRCPKSIKKVPGGQGIRCWRCW